MAMEWVNTGTGQTSSHNPGTMNGPCSNTPGIYNNGQNVNQWQQRWVPDPPRPVSFSSSASTTFYHGSSSGSGTYVGSGGVSTPIDWSGLWTFTKRSVMVLVLLLAAWVALARSTAPLRGEGLRVVEATGNRIFLPQPVIVGSVYHYSASEVMKYGWLHSSSRPVHLNGRDVVVSGNVHGAHIHANGNLVFEGNLVNTDVVDSDWTVITTNVTDSHLTARQIIITGTAVGSTETIMPSKDMKMSVKPRRKH